MYQQTDSSIATKTFISKGIKIVDEEKNASC